MQRRRLVGLVAILLIALVSGAWLLRGRIEWAVNRRQSEQAAEARRRQDVAIIRSAEIPHPGVLYGALMREGTRPELDLADRVIELSRAADPQIRAGAAFFLGSLGGEKAAEAIEKLAGDRDDTVRGHLMRGLGQRPSSENRRKIEEILERPNLGVAEKVDGYEALYRGAKLRADREAALKKLFEFSKSAKNASLRERAVATLLTLEPGNEYVVELSKKAVESNLWPGITPIALRNLAFQRNPWLEEHLAKLFETKSPAARADLYAILPMDCPLRRWEYLEAGLASEKDESVRAAILQSIAAMPGPDASGFLARVIEKYRTRLTPRETASLGALLRNSSSGKAISPCQPPASAK